MTVANLPLPEHPLRQSLNDELHARPPMPVEGPTWVSHLVMLHQTDTGRVSAAEEEAHLQALCDRTQSPFTSQIHGNHWILQGQNLRLKWERHNEFSSYTLFRTRREQDGPQTTALQAFPPDWCGAIPGRLMVAAHVEYCTDREHDPEALLASVYASNETMVVSHIVDGMALLVSDFRLHDGFTRYLIIDSRLNTRLAGGTLQRVLEIETYRMMALLSFPVARDVSLHLSRAEQEAAALMAEMATDQGPEGERLILSRLTRLAADIELSVSQTAFRFGAAEAYYALVRQRIIDLREQRIDGIPTVQGFMDRRLAPAMQTCLSVARRQNELSSRIARNSALLRTRVDIELERQNQELLAQMNRRSHLQLRLQETVEGLSIVAITYYASQLVHYLAKGIQEYQHAVNAEVATAVAIPVIAALVAWGLRRMRRALTVADTGREP